MKYQFDRNDLSSALSQYIQKQGIYNPDTQEGTITWSIRGNNLDNLTATVDVKPKEEVEVKEEYKAGGWKDETIDFS